MNHQETKICIIGLGYVGLPLAVEFAKTQLAPVIGFDINLEKIEKLKNGIDPTNEVGDDIVKKAKILFTSDPAQIKKANFIIVAVPTPIDGKKLPDLSLVESAAKIVGQNLQPGSIVVFESTVYPGVTQDICVSIIEKESGFKGGVDFKVGYSPERVNPGDKEHTIDKIIKIVSGQDKESLEVIANVYGLICKAGLHRAPSIKVAEAAKVIENIQRDLNIALVNELALIFGLLKIDTKDVLAAAATKWNFHRYYPGLVGGHCIGVDPYYLTYKAQQLGYEPKVILAGRELNDLMAEVIAKKVIVNLSSKKNARVLVMGLAFKENVNDFRNSKAKDLIQVLQKADIEVLATDPLADNGQLEKNFGVKNSQWQEVSNLDGIIYLVPHKDFSGITLKDLKSKCNTPAVLFDLRGIYSKDQAQQLGFKYLSL